MRNTVVVALFLLISFNDGSQGSNILALFPQPIRSHFIMYEKLVNALVQKGHDVYVVSHFSPSTPTKGYHDMSIKGSTTLMEDNISVDEVWGSTIIHQMAWQYKEQGRDLCEAILQHPSMEQLKTSNVTFDVIITEIAGTDCLIGFSHLFKAPMIGISATMHMPWAFDRIGNPDNPSYMANYFIPRNGKEILIYKIEKVIATIASKIGYHVFSTIPSEMRARAFFGDNLVPLDELAFKTAILLTNTHFTINEAKPTLPSVVEVGGLHIDQKTTNALPKDLKQFLTEKPEGIIYFSLSTVLDMQTFDTKKLEAILKVLTNSPYKIIMRHDKNSIPEKYKSKVYTKNWLPQLDILCHPKTKLFITSGGLMSMQEAAFCGVPVLGLPFFANQILNVNTFVNKHAGESLDYDQITEAVFGAALDKVLSSNYTDSAKEVSRKFKDRPVDALSNAVYWIEYVIRYKGAPHLRSLGADLIWFEYFSVDVALVFMIFAFLFIAFLIQLLNFLQSYFEVKDTSAKKQKKN